MTAHDYARTLADKGWPLSHIARASGLHISALADLKRPTRLGYGDFERPKPAPVPALPSNPNIRKVEESCARFGITRSEARTKTRKHNIAHLRQGVMFDLYVNHPNLSMPHIAHLLNLSDHTTIHHGINRHAKRVGLTYDQVKAMRRARAEELNIALPSGPITKEQRRERARFWK